MTMHSITPALLLAAAALTHASTPSSGCGKDAPWKLANLTWDSMENGGLNRRFIANLPSSYDSNIATPLILSFHGNGRGAKEQTQTDFLYNETWNANSIVMYPQAHNGYWQDAPYHVTGVDDLNFTSALIANLSSSLCIDTSRIYCTGKSIGGGFCNMLACDNELSSKFAAIAPVAGAFYTTPANETFESNCKPSHQMPMMEFHGKSDATIPYEGDKNYGVELPSIPRWTKHWGVANGCSNDTSPTVHKLHNDTVIWASYSCNSSDGTVQHYAIEDLMHDWPATAWNYDNQGYSALQAPFNATPIILDFFANWTLDSTSTSSSSSSSGTSTAGSATSSKASATSSTSSNSAMVVMPTAFPGLVAAIAFGALVL